MRLSSTATEGLLAAEYGGADGDLGGIVLSTLLGSWSATRWQYTSRGATPRAADVVVDLRGTVTLSLSAGSWILSWDLPGQASQTIGGTWRYQGDRIELRRRGAGESEVLHVRLGADTISLSADESSWDFGGGAPEPAAFVAVFVRL